MGPAEVLGFFRSTGSAFTAAGILPSRHHLSSVHVQPRPDGSAATYACFQLVSTSGPDHWGTYRDEIVATPDGWRFAKRKVKIEGHVANSPVVALLGLTTVTGPSAP